MKLNYTLHSHTFRCGHATGDVEDYVSLAIKNGFKIYGVSDHVFLPGIVQPTVRGNYELLDEYINVFNEAKLKHKNEVTMFLGFECEYGDVFADYYKYLLTERHFDYLICGQHMHISDDKRHHWYFDSEESFIEYKNDLIKAMTSGLFLYIAHPDLYFIAKQENDDLARQITKEIIDAAIKYDAVLEINRHGFLRDRNVAIQYPCDYFWSEVAKTNIKVVIGGDFHDLWEIEDGRLEDELNSFIERNNLKITNIEDVLKNYKERIKKIL